MDLGIRGKAALVTAASKGMGKATALGLAAEGARVLMCARGEAALKLAADEVRTKTGAEVIAMTADVTKKDDVERLITRADEAFGGVDILVANAGGPPRGNLSEMTDEQWYGAFDTTMLFVVRLIRGVLPAMQRKKLGPHPHDPVGVGEAAGAGPAALERDAAGRGRDGEDAGGGARQAQHHDQRRLSRARSSPTVCSAVSSSPGCRARTFLQKAGLDIPLGRVGHRRRSSRTSWCSSPPSVRRT